MKKTKKQKVKIEEISSSFSFKKNLGNYQTCDFWFSAKAKVHKAKEEATAQALYQFCKEMVVNSMNAYIKEQEELKMAEIAKANQPKQAEPKNTIKINKFGKDDKNFEEKEAMAHNEMDSKAGR